MCVKYKKKITIVLGLKSRVVTFTFHQPIFPPQNSRTSQPATYASVPVSSTVINHNRSTLISPNRPPPKPTPEQPSTQRLPQSQLPEAGENKAKPKNKSVVKQIWKKGKKVESISKKGKKKLKSIVFCHCRRGKEEGRKLFRSSGFLGFSCDDAWTHAPPLFLHCQKPSQQFPGFLRAIM